MNNHIYLPQTDQLRNLIQSVWQVDRLGAPQYEHIIPKGIIEVIFNFTDGAPISAQLGDQPYQLSRCFINGFNTVPVRLQIPRHQVFFGIQLQPLAAKKIFKTPGSEFADKAVDLTLIDSTFDILWHQLAETKTFDERVAIICSYLQKKVIDWQPQEKLMNRFLGAIDQHDLTVYSVADTLCYSARHLSRKLLEATGMNAEQILLYKKYLYALHLIHNTDFQMVQVAYESNFSDQAHFTKAFKHFTQMTPGEYSRNKSLVKGHLFQDVR